MLKKWLIISVISMLFIITLPIIQADTDHYSNSIIIVSGNSNLVTSTGLWLFGLTYINKEEITIKAQNEAEERINVFIFPPNFGFYFSQENILIQMGNAEGFLFWGQKSLFLNNASQRVFTLCKADDIWITY